jgi:regulator of protease activity HflC (stomatin/prohibitin superfamily)
MRASHRAPPEGDGMQYSLIAMLVVGAVVFAGIMAFLSTFYIVEQSTAAIVQRFGKFAREAGPGIRIKIPFVDKVVGRVNLRVRQMDVEIETKTTDDVFVRVTVAVQYYALSDRIYDAFYKLDDASRQITSFVFDVVRTQVPKIGLDDVFAKKDDLAEIVKIELAQAMKGFGYGILKVLVTDIEPDAEVKRAMNENYAALRQREAATAHAPYGHRHHAAKSPPGNGG